MTGDERIAAIGMAGTLGAGLGVVFTLLILAALGMFSQTQQPQPQPVKTSWREYEGSYRNPIHVSDLEGCKVFLYNGRISVIELKNAEKSK